MKLYFFYLLSFLSLSICIQAQTRQDRNKELLIAIQLNQRETVKKLLSQGANPNHRDSHKATPLMWAAYMADLEMVKLLVEKKADFTKKGTIHTGTGSYYGNLTGIAAGEGKLDILQYLIEECKIAVDDQEFNPNDQKENGWNALQWACSRGNLPITDYLLKKGADIQVFDGATLLHHAIASKNKELIRLLIDKGVALDKKSYQGYTPLHYATLYQMPEIVKLLLNKGVNTQDKMPGGYTAFQEATKKFYLEVVDVFIENVPQLDVNELLPTKASALHLFCANGFYELAEKLIQHKANVNIRDGHEYTPLMYAAYNNQTRICKLLIDHGADKTLKNNQGQNALQIAEERKVSETVAYLQNTANYQEPDKWQILNQEVVRLVNAHHPDKAIKPGTEALNYVVQKYGKNTPEYGSATRNLARLYAQLKDYQKARDFFTQSLTCFPENSADYRQTLKELASNELSSENYKKAKELYRQLLTYQESDTQQDKRQYNQAISNMALVEYRLGNYFQAEMYFQKNKQLTKKLYGTRHPEYAACLNNLAEVYQVLGNYTQAHALYKEAAGIYSALQDTDEYSTQKHLTTVANIASVLHDTGKYQMAKYYYETLVIDAIKTKLKGEYPYLGIYYNNLGGLYMDLGQYDKAEENLIRALREKKRTLGETHSGYANTLSNIADVYLYKKQYKKAESLYKKALEIKKQQLGEKHPSYGVTLNNLAQLYSDQHNYTKAEEIYLKVVEIQKHNYGTDSPVYATYLNNLGAFYSLEKKYTKAENFLRQAIQIREKHLHKYNRDLGISYFNMGNLYQALQKEELAEEFYTKGLDVYLYQIFEYLQFTSEKEQLDFINTMKNSFNRFYAFGIQRAKQNPQILTKIYNARLASKGLLLSTRKKIREKINASKDTAVVKLYEEFVEAKKRLNTIYQLPKSALEKQNISLAQTESKVNRLEALLAGVSKAKEKTKQVEWKEIQKSLTQGEAAIEVMTFPNGKEQKVYVALILTAETKKYPELVVLENGALLEKKFIKYYQNAIKYKKRDKYSYENFWKPVTKKLKGIKKIYFSPDGIYNQLSMNTLQNPVTEKFLIDEVNLEVKTNLKELVKKVKAGLRENTKDFIFFGYPNYNLEKETHIKAVKKYIRSGNTEEKTLSTRTPSPVRTIKENTKTTAQISLLPGTKLEIETIEKVLQGKGIKSVSYLGNEALEEVVKAVENPKVLHIATHGYFLQDVEDGDQYEKVLGVQKSVLKENPLLRSGLMLTGAVRNLREEDNQDLTLENGILTAYEAINLQLDATDLVVLSACETGLGEIKNGEGVYGLQRAFQIAGAESILMSLWTVSDKATQKLMTYFYQNWLDGKSKREAFREAQLKLREEYPHPYYWGAFVMIGN